MFRIWLFVRIFGHDIYTICKNGVIILRVGFAERNQRGNAEQPQQTTLWIRHKRGIKMSRKSGIFENKKTDIFIGRLD
jgi:hypothetical protein